jgi:transcriptional regulator with XRE-family HTH domain
MSHSHTWKVFGGEIYGSAKDCAAKWAAGFPASMPGAGLKLLRESMGLSRKDLAGYLGCAERRVARWENAGAGADPMSERALRVLYLNSVGDRVGFEDMRALLELTEEWPCSVRLEDRPTGWRVVERWYAEAKKPKGIPAPRKRREKPVKRLGKSALRVVKGGKAA